MRFVLAGAALTLVGCAAERPAVEDFICHSERMGARYASAVRNIGGEIVAYEGQDRNSIPFRVDESNSEDFECVPRAKLVDAGRKLEAPGDRCVALNLKPGDVGWAELRCSQFDLDAIALEWTEAARAREAREAAEEAKIKDAMERAIDDYEEVEKAEEEAEMGALMDRGAEKAHAAE